jgi:hypothetical protein
VVACGSPVDIVKDSKRSYTAHFLREYLNGGVVTAKPARQKIALEEAPA